jgi:hypothetical protein
MEKVQYLKSSNTAPSSQTFRDEYLFIIYICFFNDTVSSSDYIALNDYILECFVNNDLESMCEETVVA